MLDLEYLDSESVDRIKLIGRLGAANSTVVSAELAAIINSGTGTLHLDLIELEFLDSSGLSALVALLKLARKEQGDLVLFNASNRVRSLFELTRLHEIFELRDDDLASVSGF